MKGFSLFFLLPLNALCSKVKPTVNNRQDLKNDLLVAPSYYGFHFMLPFDYHQVLENTHVLEELHYIFLGRQVKRQDDISSYLKIAQQMYNLCVTCSKKNLPTPHHIFAFDNAFCQSLIPRMKRWYSFMSLFTPVLKAFQKVTLDLEDLEIGVYKMAYIVLNAVESADLNILQADKATVEAALLALLDISETIERVIQTDVIYDTFRDRFYQVLCIFLSRSLKQLPHSDAKVEYDLETLKVTADMMEAFQKCYYAYEKPIAECSVHVFGRKVESLVKLSNTIHFVQNINSYMPLATQRAFKFVLSNLIEQQLIPNVDIQKHLTVKLPVIKIPSRKEVIGHRVRDIKVLLPDIFSFYLEQEYPEYLNHFRVHRVLSEIASHTSSPIKPLDPPAPELTEFTAFYNRISPHSISLPCVYKEYENLGLAMAAFAEELSVCANGSEIWKGIMGLITFYIGEGFIAEDDMGLAIRNLSIWFHPKYLPDSKK